MSAARARTTGTCANCGRPMLRVEPNRPDGGYWMHKIDGGGDSDCHLSASPERTTYRRIEWIGQPFQAVLDKLELGQELEVLSPDEMDILIEGIARIRDRHRVYPDAPGRRS